MPEMLHDVDGELQARMRVGVGRHLDEAQAYLAYREAMVQLLR